MAVMGMLDVTMGFVMRACLGITLTQIVRPVVVDGDPRSTIQYDYCPMPQSSVRNQLLSNLTTMVVVQYQNRFDWTRRHRRFGGKHTMGLGILSIAIFTLLTPYVAYMGSRPLTILRFVEGLREGTTFPALYTPLAQWAPPDEKGKLTTVVFAGINIFQVAVHEIGHALGLPHSSIRSSVMAPFYNGYNPSFKLDSSDVRVIQALYGVNISAKGPGNDDDSTSQESSKTTTAQEHLTPGTYCGNNCDAATLNVRKVRRRLTYS